MARENAVGDALTVSLLDSVVAALDRGSEAVFAIAVRHQICGPLHLGAGVAVAGLGLNHARRLLRLFEQEDVNFLLTNRIPRRLLTRFMGWFSRI